MQVGQTVWVTGGFRDKGITADVISKIGNKYFYLTGSDNKFDLKTLRSVTNGNYPYQVYLSLEIYQLEQETIILTDKIKKAFSGWGKLPYTLEQLRAIDKIISEEVQ
jgi:hypothetical protein